MNIINVTYLFLYEPNTSMPKSVNQLIAKSLPVMATNW